MKEKCDQGSACHCRLQEAQSRDPDKVFFVSGDESEVDALMDRELGKYFVFHWTRGSAEVFAWKKDDDPGSAPDWWKDKYWPKEEKGIA